MSIQIKIEGLEEAIKKMSPDLYAEPLRRFWERSSLSVENQAKLNSPVDTGRTRASLTHQLDSGSPPIWAKVGTNVTNKGVSYPQVLDLSDRTHYRGGPHEGQPTKGWFSGSYGRVVSEVQNWIGRMAEEIADRWQK